MNPGYVIWTPSAPGPALWDGTLVLHSEILWGLRQTTENTKNLPWSLISEQHALTRSSVRDGSSQTVLCCLAPLWLFCSEILVHLSSITHLWSLHKPLFPLEVSQIHVSAPSNLCWAHLLSRIRFYHCLGLFTSRASAYISDLHTQVLEWSRSSITAGEFPRWSTG